MQPTRRLAAILFTDIVSSTALMQRNEETAMAINKHYVTVLKECVSLHCGEIVNDYGDGSLCIFSSATEAMRCAVKLQEQFRIEPKVPLRIGLHVGEIFFDEGKVFGDGVNVASRVQSLGIANSVLFSSEINSKIRNQQEFTCASLGKFHFKNVSELIEVFALSNEDLSVPKRKELTGKLEEIKKKSLRRKWLSMAIALSILAAFFIGYNFFRSKEAPPSEKSIAVLPFENEGVTDNELYISDGITQDIINKLSKISSLQKVIAWFSVKSFKKTTKTIKQIADELEVTVILTGTIQRHADKIQVIAELIDVNSNKRLWGNNYDYDLSDALTIQSDVAQQIVNALRANLSDEEKKELSKNYTENVEAYKFYRKGRAFWDARTTASFDSAESNYKRALELDPDYALAYSGLADCYMYNQKGLSQVEAVPIGKDYALKALSLDSNLSEALTTLGFIESAFDYNWAKSKITLQKAIKLNPNYPIAHMYYGNLLQYTGESSEEGIKEVKKALELDPLSVSINWVLGRNYFLAGKYDLAYDQLKKTITIDPNYVLAKGTLFYLLLDQKKFTEAIELAKQLPLKNPYIYRDAYLCYGYAAAGDTGLAKAILIKTLKDYPDQDMVVLARCNIIFKNYSAAIDELGKAYQQRNLGVYNFFKLDHTLDPIRNEPGFKELLKKTNLE